MGHPAYITHTAFIVQNTENMFMQNQQKLSVWYAEKIHGLTGRQQQQVQGRQRAIKHHGVLVNHVKYRTKTRGRSKYPVDTSPKMK